MQDADFVQVRLLDTFPILTSPCLQRIPMNYHFFRVTLLIFVSVVLFFSPSVHGQDEVPQQAQAGSDGSNPTAGDEVLQQQISYTLGLSIGRDLRASGMEENEVDFENMFAGLEDGVRGNDPRLSEEVLTAAIERFQQQLQNRARRKMGAAADRNKQKATAFLKENRGRPGVVETASGLQYKVLKKGEGPSPTLSDEVSTLYVGTLLDGTEFDSSYRRGKPAKFPVGRVIPGWTEALQKMRVGDKWQLFIPPELAYVSNPPGATIEPNSLLVFEIELLGIGP